jgi:hypothetical protein
MKGHGIFSTNAVVQIHLHPIDPDVLTGAVYWYRVAAMRRHIELTKPRTVLGFSKDAAQTLSGAGYLIPKSTFFISGMKLPPRYCAGHDWRNATDRENGQRGEQIVAALIDHGVIQLMRQVSISTRTLEDQYAGVDGEVFWNRKTRFEAKTETYQSGNLYVQTHEGGHRPNYLADGVERVTTLLPLFKGRA